MLKEFSSREAAGNLSGRDKQVPAVKDCRFTQTAFGTVVHDSSVVQPNELVWNSDDISSRTFEIDTNSTSGRFTLLTPPPDTHQWPGGAYR